MRINSIFQNMKQKLLQSKKEQLFQNQMLQYIIQVMNFYKIAIFLIFPAFSLCISEVKDSISPLQNNLQNNVHIWKLEYRGLYQTSNEQSSSNNQEKLHKWRVLQSNTSTDNLFISTSTITFQKIFPFMRNLILIGIITNSIDLFLPYLILSQSFLMLGFWVCEKHYLTILYSNIFSSSLDILNAVRLLIHPNNTIPNLLQLSRYGFSSIFLYNIAGELFVAIILLLLTVLLKLTTVFSTVEYFRKISFNLNSIWSSFFFSIFPRIATFTGLHWRQFGHGSSLDVLNGFTCSIVSALIIGYFILILKQIRKIKEKPMIIKYSRISIGLGLRIDYKMKLNFDFFEFSGLYYPCINYIRLFVFYFPIGLFWNCQQLTYGGPLASQFLMLMIEISSTCYYLLRDKLLFPIQNFIFMIIQICIITIGLMESIPYSELSQKMEVVIYCLSILIFGSSLVTTCMDSWVSIFRSCNNRVSQEISELIKEDTNTLHDFRQNIHAKVRKTQSNQEQGNKQQNCFKDDENRQFTVSFTNNSQLSKVKIKNTLEKRAKTNIFFK